MKAITILLGTILEDIKKAVTVKAESTQQTEEVRWSFMDTWMTWLTETMKNNLSYYNEII